MSFLGLCIHFYYVPVLILDAGSSVTFGRSEFFSVLLGA